MTIRTKLILSALIEAFLVLIVSGLLISFSNMLSQARYNEAQSTKIVDTISQIRFVTFEHLLHHDQRSFEQWQDKEKELQDLFKPTPQADQTTRSTLSSIASLSHDIEGIFNRLVESDPAINSGTQTAEQQALQERLASQLLIKQQTQITQALALAAHTQQTATDLNNASSLLILCVVVVMLLITVANYVFTTRTIAHSLGELQTGAEMIALGNFAYHIHPHNPNDEFGKVAQAFNSMATSAGAIDQEKTEFILLASHQLRTPLTAVKWYAEALAKHAETLSSPRLKQYASQVYDSNERMIELVDKLLDTARIEAGSLQSQPRLVNLEDTLKQVTQDLKPQMSDNHIKVAKDIEKDFPAVFVDPSWVQVILENLLSNAVRYSHKGKTVEVKMEKQDNHALISVTDSGFGIPASQRDKIFTKLFRADNAKQVISEGSGLDLYIAKAMAERAGGRIWFTSVENKGTTFFVSLPLHTRHMPPASGTITEARPTRKGSK